MRKEKYKIIYEDEDIVVVNKAAPLLTIPDRYDQTIPNLIDLLSVGRESVLINHRLDKETSGVILFTKNEKAHKHVSKQFEERSVKKHYLTLLQGTPAEEVGLIDLALAPVKGIGMTVDVDGKPSRTKYRILESFPVYSYVEVSILTGRTHQIRVHMKSIGCPVMCDAKYGDGVPFLLSSIKRKINKRQDEEEKPLLHRLALHSSLLGLTHPTTGEQLEFTAEMPKDMRAVLYQLRKKYSPKV